MADIKTRETVKGTIKTLDKAAIAGQKMKQAYIATKDKAEHSVNTNENTAEEYAADKTEAGIDEIAHKGAYAFDKAGRNGVQETNQNIQSAKEGMDMTMKCPHSSIKSLPLCLTTRLKEQRKKDLNLSLIHI